MRTSRLVIILLPLALAGCNEDAPPPAPLRPVLTTTVEPITSNVFGPFASTVEARYQTQLGFQLAGRMVSRDVFVGDEVRKGQRLAAIDPVVIQFALLRAKADVANAQAQLVNAEGIEARQRSLSTTGNVSQATLDNAVAGRDTAKARLDQAQASLRLAEDQIGYTELRADFDAVVTGWSAEIGQYVDTGQAVVTLARPDVREAVVDIPDELVGHVASGMEFVARLQVAPTITARALVREIGPLADEVTRAHRVRLTLMDPSEAFRLGTTITVSRTTPVTPHVALPADVILQNDGQTFVWLLAPDGKRVERRAIKVLDRTDDHVRVASGLATGDRVVIVGVHSLTDGEAVAGALGDLGASVVKIGDKHL